MLSNQQISSERTIAALEDKKVEVSIEGDKAVIRMSGYADGIGWFVQKTITVDADMLDVLADQFVAANGKLRREGDDILSADLLDF
ncbi:MAG: hypothetical protein PSX80_08280 [bacterium]|nr:hypothetical protein [bacterium]